MALIKCKECGKEISGTAESCPHCGYRTAHGRSVTEAKSLLAQWVICVALIVVGLIMVFGNIGTLAEYLNKWEYVNEWSGISFIEYLDDKGESSVLWKVIFGISFLIGGIIDLVIIKTKTDSLGGNGFDAERREMVYTNAAKEEGLEFWECASCGQHNLEHVGTCQNCGVTKNWSEARRKR